jgi:hypothetical protein
MKYPRSSYDEMQFARPRHLDRNREHLEEGMPGIPSTSTLVHLGSYNVLEAHELHRTSGVWRYRLHNPERSFILKIF